MSSKKHSPLPWKIDEHGFIVSDGEGPSSIRVAVADPDTDYVLCCNPDIVKANAAFIVQAVNSHDALVLAVKDLYGYAILITASQLTDVDETYNVYADKLKRAHAALKLAKEGK